VLLPVVSCQKVQSRSLNDALVKSESGHVFLFKTAKDDNKDPKIQRSKDPKIQKGDNHHSRVRFSFHFHYLKTKNPDREKIDVKLKMARTSLVIKSVMSPNQKMPPSDQRTIQLNIIAAAPFRYKHIGPPFDLLLPSALG
jgi:hypothetical protein